MKHAAQLSGKWEMAQAFTGKSIFLFNCHVFPPTQNDKTQKWMQRGHTHSGHCPFKSFWRRWEFSSWSRLGRVKKKKRIYSIFIFLIYMIKNLFFMSRHLFRLRRTNQKNNNRLVFKQALEYRCCLSIYLNSYVFSTFIYQHCLFLLQASRFLLWYEVSVLVAHHRCCKWVETAQQIFSHESGKTSDALCVCSFCACLQVHMCLGPQFHITVLAVVNCMQISSCQSCSSGSCPPHSWTASEQKGREAAPRCALLLGSYVFGERHLRDAENWDRCWECRMTGKCGGGWKRVLKWKGKEPAVFLSRTCC